MKTRHPFTSLLGLSILALFAAALPAARAGEPATARIAHQKRHVAYTTAPIRIIAEPMPAPEQPLNPADYRSFQENNLVNPG